MKVQSEVRRPYSPMLVERPLRASGENFVSVVENVLPLPGLVWSVVPHATSPAANGPGAAALQLESTGWVASSLITTDEGVAAVRVFETRSRFTPRLTMLLGVTGHEQQDT